MRVAAETAIEIVHLLVHHGVPRHQLVELGKLLLVGQFAVKQQVTHFDVAAFLGQLVDRVAAIKQFALVAVDIGDRAVAGGGRGKARIVSEHACLGVEGSNVDHVRPHCPGQHREFMSLIPDDEFGDFIGHLALLEGPETQTEGVRKGWSQIIGSGDCQGQVTLLPG
jgi:hypothetical protein